MKKPQKNPKKLWINWKVILQQNKKPKRNPPPPRQEMLGVITKTNWKKIIILTQMFLFCIAI